MEREDSIRAGQYESRKRYNYIGQVLRGVIPADPERHGWLGFDDLAGRPSILQKVHRAALHVQDAGMPADVVTVAARLMETGELHALGGLTFLESLFVY